MLWGINGYSVGRPHNLGLKNNMLLPCPKSPNCVLSQASDPKHKIKPIYYATSVEAAKEKLIGQVVEVRADAITQNQNAKDEWSLRFPRFLRFRGFEVGEKL